MTVATGLRSRVASVHLLAILAKWIAKAHKVSRSAGRPSFALLVALSVHLTPFDPTYPASAGRLSQPAEIVVQPADVPPDLIPVEESGIERLLPNDLARQAASSFRRDPSRDLNPGVTYIRQDVLVFDGRAAIEYLPRFRDLIVRHQGYVVVGTREGEFRLAKTRADQSSIMVGAAVAEVLVMTTVNGRTGTIEAEDAARLNQTAIARVPAIERTAAALSGGTVPASLSAATTGPGYLEIPDQQDAGRWPEPLANLPGPPPIDVVQPRDHRARGDRSLDVLLPPPPQKDRAGGWPPDLMTYASSIGPLLDEFWSRALALTDVDYLPPRFMVIPAGVAVRTGCLRANGEPAVADTLAYCAADQTVYIYEPFMRNELVAGPEWRARDFVVATVIAHEWGHHIQHLTGLIDVSVAQVVNSPDRWPLITRQRELQADCYAGMFARYARDRGWLNPGDIDEAREALVRAGDEQVDSPGHHGTPQQRAEWFARGYVHYAFRACEPW